jgi:DNA polymerase-3 subunit beta
MNLTIERASALTAISRVVGVVERKGNIPILGNVALSAVGDRLRLRATDLDMEALESLEARVTVGGDITIPADKLHDIVRNVAPGADLSISLGEGDPRLQIRSGRSRFNVPALSIDEFPIFASEGLEAVLTLPASTLADMIGRVAPFVDKSTARGQMYNLSCVYLATVGDQIHAVGASSSGIALRREPRGEAAEFSAILPPKLVGRLASWFDDEGDVTIHRSDSLIRFVSGERVLTSKVFDFTAYAQYEQALIEQHDAYARFDRDELIASIRRVMILSSGSTVYLTLAEDAQLRGRGEGDAVDQIAVEYEGPERKLKLKSSHVLDLLSQLRGDIVELGFSREDDLDVVDTGKVIVRAPCDPAFTAITMQMKV